MEGQKRQRQRESGRIFRQDHGRYHFHKSEVEYVKVESYWNLLRDCFVTGDIQCLEWTVHYVDISVV